MLTMDDIMDWYEEYCEECAKKNIQPKKDMMDWWDNLE